MAKSTDHNMMRQKLIKGVIDTIAKYGLEGCTTKQISKESELNESYIYRYFLDRDDLIRKAFIIDDEKVFEVMTKALRHFDNKDVDFITRLTNFGNEIYDFYFSDVVYGIFYTRVYYSLFFKDQLLEEHYKIVNKFYEEVKKYFTVENPQNLLHVVFNNSLDYLLLTSRHIIEDTPENRLISFKQIIDLCCNHVQTV